MPWLLVADSVSAPQRVQRALAWRIRNAYWTLVQLPAQLRAWVGFLSNKHHYELLTEAQLRDSRRSDTVFIFGSGGSLNDISASEWRAIEAHDTFGFNWFVHQQFVRSDFHVVREIGEWQDWRSDIRRYFDLINSNPRFANTRFLVQTGLGGVNGNRAIWLRLLPRLRRVFLFRSHRGSRLPSTSLADGVAHTEGTLSDCINLAALLGWRHIVLCGVDLYNRQYFWLPSGEPRHGDSTTVGPHNTAIGGIVDSVGAWREFYARQGVSLYVYNPKSLLAQVLPVWQRPAETIRA
ncbi:MAG TPA: hypothetical protein VM096_04755 [Vicinamibacterales bacterium]|nr:hypothetical protein [Vicinamibacterales bacterium]